jgi:hypothetical protein
MIARIIRFLWEAILELAVSEHPELEKNTFVNKK